MRIPAKVDRPPRPQAGLSAQAGMATVTAKQ